ncbi:MAG: glycosyltransferase family 39 protein [Spirochaetes bacterium]|nr:glycosyltransferase family 39 protein [Spirochaetota bacterium]
MNNIKIRNFINKIKLNKNNSTTTKLFEIIFKIIYVLIIIIICINIISYSYKAWLYPIRKSQYFDECSYIAMGKYFRTISPIKILKDHILENKPIPEIYHEFNCRLIYWPIILSIPLTYTEDRIQLHIFRAILMTIGTIIFFLLGHKLSGITGGVAASAFWIGTPILNYWGHFFMTESPSLIFLAAGYLFLLYSDRFGLSSFIGGVLLGIAAFTRFTTILLLFSAPFFILAVYFNPFKRKTFQLIGEWAKAFAGFALITLPYLIFTWWMFKNPFVPFINARVAVDNFAVDDPAYYVRNLWIEGGGLIRIGAIIAIISPFILSLAWIIKRIIKDKNTYSRYFNKLRRQTHSNLNIRALLKRKIIFFRYLRTFGNGIIYHGIIITSLIISTSIYLLGVSNIPHKLPRYLMGALIPVIIIASMGFGAIEPLFIYLFRVIGNTFLSNYKKLTKKFKRKRILFISIWIIGFLAAIIITSLIAINVWNKTMARPFYVWYEVPNKVIKKLEEKKDKTSILRLQPESVSWKYSIGYRLKEVENNPKKGIDNKSYYGKFSWKILKYLNKKLKYDEVLYVDRFNKPPFPPAYAEVPCMYIDHNYNYSIDNLINNRELLYKGYVLVNNNPGKDVYKKNKKTYIRSLNKNAIKASKKFKFVKKFGNLELYYFKKGEPFPYKFGTKERIAKLYKKEKIVSETNNEDKKTNNSIKKTFNKLFHSWQQLLKYEFKEEALPPPPKKRKK